MSTPDQFARKMTRVAHDVQGAEMGIVKRAALETKKAVQAQLAVAAPRGRLNVGKAGKKIGVRYTVGTDSARVFMFGPAQLIEWDTKAHRIPRATKGRGKKQTANRKAIYIPGVGFRQWANHPGTKGKHPWRKGLVAAEPRVGRASADYYFGTVKKALR
jgi:hypothetical protein